ncbi:MAG: ATP synthase F1 subunit gamma [Patescibacteria group bacterium]
MAVNTKAIKNRIRSVKNTKKITKAMEMMSAVKMRKAINNAINTRLYARLAQELIEHVSKIEEPNVDLLEVRPVKNMLVILVSSNKGLCGSFNSNILRKAKMILDDVKNVARHRISNTNEILPADKINVDMIGIGKKGANFAKKYGYNLLAIYEKLTDRPDMDEVVPVARQAVTLFKEKKYDKVIVVYTDFKSSMKQEAKVRQLLPFSSTDLEKMISSLGDEKNQKKVSEEIDDLKKDKVDMVNCIFEPSLDVVIENVFPRLVEIQLYQAVLESVASEHSSRMMAMKNASESADEMIKELNLSFNKARQAGITQEISEISGGAAALE